MSDQRLRELERDHARGQAGAEELQRARARVDPVVVLEDAFEALLVKLEGKVRARVETAAENLNRLAENTAMRGLTLSPTVVASGVTLSVEEVGPYISGGEELYFVSSLEPILDLAALTGERSQTIRWAQLYLNRRTGLLRAPWADGGWRPSPGSEGTPGSPCGHLLDEYGGGGCLGPFGPVLAGPGAPGQRPAIPVDELRSMWAELARQCQLPRPITSIRARPRGSATSEGATSQAAHEQAVSPRPGTSEGS